MEYESVAENQTDLLHNEKVRKQRLLARICYAFATILFIYISAISFILPGFTIAKVLAVLSIIVLIAAGWLARSERFFRASAWTVVVNTIVIATGASVSNGGLEGYLAPILITAPVAAALFLGPRAALVSAGAVVCALSALLFLDTYGLISNPPYAAEDIRVAAFILLSTTVLVCASGMSIFAEHSNRLIEQLMLSQKQLGESEQTAKLQRLYAEEKREDAEQASQAKDRFLSNVSHEVRTPLNGVVSLIDVLEGTPLNEQQQDMVRLVKSSSQSLQRIIEDILCVSKLEHASFELKYSDFDLATEVQNAAHPFDALASEKQIVLSIDFSDQARGKYHGDPIRLRQIVSNLVSNAIKFTDQGKVTVAVDLTNELDYTAGPVVQIRVEDTGIGFTPEFSGKLFEPFEQGPQSEHQSQSGTGLGLSIVKELTRHMGGQVYADSQQGHGSVFTVNIPLKRVSETLGATTPPIQEATINLTRSRPHKILCADDHPVNKQVVSLILNATQFDVTHVSDGIEAVDAFNADSFDLILMDMQMPNLNGIEATVKIREIEKREGRGHTPIVMLSANAFDSHIETAAEAGCDRHIPKPFTPESLINGILSALKESDAGLTQSDPA